MFKKIFFDHAFNEDPNHHFFKRLGKLGFTLSDMKVEHPGKAHCRFIELEGNTNRGKAYLEFVRVGKGGKSFNAAGLSLGYKENLESFYKKISKKLKAHFFHKNYDWKKNSTDKLPGWNMITLLNPPMRNIYTWFTEYEEHSSRKKKAKLAPKHANTVYGIYGLDLVLTDKAHLYLETLLGKKLKEKTRLSDGTYLFIKKGSVNYFKNIILKCKSLETANKFIRDSGQEYFDNKNSLRIKNAKGSKKMWSLIVVEE